MVCKKETQDKCLISLFNHIGIETGNRKESESVSRIGIDKIQTIPNPSENTLAFSARLTWFTRLTLSRSVTSAPLLSRALITSICRCSAAQMMGVQPPLSWNTEMRWKLGNAYFCHRIYTYILKKIITGVIATSYLTIVTFSHNSEFVSNDSQFFFQNCKM